MKALAVPDGIPYTILLDADSKAQLSFFGALRERDIQRKLGALLDSSKDAKP